MVSRQILTNNTFCKSCQKWITGGPKGLSHHEKTSSHLNRLQHHLKSISNEERNKSQRALKNKNMMNEIETQVNNDHQNNSNFKKDFSKKRKGIRNQELFKELVAKSHFIEAKINAVTPILINEAVWCTEISNLPQHLLNDKRLWVRKNWIQRKDQATLIDCFYNSKCNVFLRIDPMSEIQKHIDYDNSNIIDDSPVSMLNSFSASNFVQKDLIKMGSWESFNSDQKQ